MMLNRESAAAYQTAAASGATQIGLLKLVYSQLAQELLRASNAVRQGDIPARCAASNRGLLLLAHLESWANDMEEAFLAASLQSFYHLLRAAILQLQATPDAATFERYAQLVLDTGEAWQKKEDQLYTAVSNASPISTGDTPQGISFRV